MKMSEKGGASRREWEEGIGEEKENQANRPFWKPSRDRDLRMRQLSAVSIPEYRSPKMRMFEDK